MREFGVGLVGLGTVGTRVAERLLAHADLLAERAGARLALRRVAVRDPSRARGVRVDPALMSADPEAVASAAGVDILVELAGGEQPARSVLEAALSAGRHAVTANKLVIARHGPALAQLAESSGAGLLFEAAVGGGMPVIAPLYESLSATRVRRIYGILNSTTNFILTRMGEGLEFAAAVAEAQRLGYAEADPSSDTEGFDAAFKISILATLAFGAHVDPDRVQRQGITNLTRTGLRAAREAGYAVKLVAEAWDDGGGAARAGVRPALVPLASPLGTCEGSSNLFCFQGDMVEDVLIAGLGAGGPATANAVVSDIVRMARGLLAGAPPRVTLPQREAEVKPLAPQPLRTFDGLQLELVTL